MMHAFIPQLWSSIILDGFKRSVMGCDISVWVEKRVHGRWQIHAVEAHLPEHTCSRNYPRFAALAGVRGSGPAPRGAPADASAEVKAACAHIDMHSCSWYPAREAAEIWASTEWEGSEIKGFAMSNPLAIFFDIDTTQEDPDDYRIVFAFDN